MRSKAPAPTAPRSSVPEEGRALTWSPAAPGPSPPLTPDSGLWETVLSCPEVSLLLCLTRVLETRARTA